MTHVTCRLTAKNRDQLRNPTLGSWVQATFTFTFFNPVPLNPNQGTDIWGQMSRHVTTVDARPIGPRTRGRLFVWRISTRGALVVLLLSVATLRVAAFSRSIIVFCAPAIILHATHQPSCCCWFSHAAIRHSKSFIGHVSNTSRWPLLEYKYIFQIKYSFVAQRLWSYDLMALYKSVYYYYYYIGNKSVPIQLAECRFPGLAISNAKIQIYIFSNKIYGSNFIKQHPDCYGLKLPKCWLQFKRNNLLCHLLWFSAHFDRSLYKRRGSLTLSETNTRPLFSCSIAYSDS